MATVDQLPREAAALLHRVADTLPAEALSPKEKVQDGALAFFLVFGARASIHTLNVAHVAVDSVYILVDFRYIVGGPPIEAAGGRPRRLRDDCVMISNGFGLLFWGALGITFGVI